MAPPPVSAALAWVGVADREGARCDRGCAAIGAHAGHQQAATAGFRQRAGSAHRLGERAIEGLRIDRAAARGQRDGTCGGEVETCSQLQRAAVEREAASVRAERVVRADGNRALIDRRAARIGVAARRSRCKRQHAGTGFIHCAGAANRSRVGARAILGKPHESIVGHGGGQVLRSRLQGRAAIDERRCARA